MRKQEDTQFLLRKIKTLESRLQIAEDYAKKLETKMHGLEKQKKMLVEEERKKSESARKNVLEGKEIVIRDSLIKNFVMEVETLRKKFSKIEELEMISNDGCAPVIPLEDFDKDKILEKNKTFGINGSVIFFEHVTDKSLVAPAKILISLQPKAVIADLDYNLILLLKNSEIPVINPKDISLMMYFDFYGADRFELEKKIKEYEKSV